jgi:hypothetical protein
LSIKVSIDTEVGNRAIADGTLTKVVEGLMDRVKPEASYFGLESGRRTMYLVADMTDVTEMPRIFEPVFLALNAMIDFTPIMDLPDLMVGFAKMEG